jgi:hypothetical protein
MIRGFVATYNFNGEKSLTKVIISTGNSHNAQPFIDEKFDEICLSGDKALARQMWNMGGRRVRELHFKDTFELEMYRANNEFNPTVQLVSSLGDIKAEMMYLMRRTEALIGNPKVAKIENVTNVFVSLRNLLEALLSMPPFNI